MPHRIESDGVSELLATLGVREYILPMPSGNATLVCTQLPGDCVSAAVRDEEDGHLYVLLDMHKPFAHAHARQMLHEWVGVAAPRGYEPLAVRLDY